LTLIQSGERPELYGRSRRLAMLLSTLTCPSFSRILPEFAAVGRTPVSLAPGFGLEGVQDRHWCTL
jgi:hypothetical protein